MVVVILLMALVVVGWYGSRAGRCGVGGVNLRGWMGRTTTEKVMENETTKDGSGDNIVLAVQHCGIILEERGEGCLRRFGSVDTSSSMAMRIGEMEAWREIKDGLEGLWRGLIESECKCHNPEMLDRMYEGLRERAGEMAGRVGELDGREVLEG